MFEREIKSNVQMNLAKHLVIMFVLLIFAVSCSSPISNSAVPAVNQSEVVPTPLDEKPKIEPEFIEKDFVKIQIQKNVPAEIINISSVNGNLDFKKEIEVEVKNISDKTIRSIDIGLAPHQNCAETLMVGDHIINSLDSNFKPNSAIKPAETISVRIPADLAESFLTRRKCTKLNPKESIKTIVYVWGVDFLDGTNWRQNVPKINDN